MSNKIVSPTLYPSPPVSIPIDSTLPGLTANTSTDCVSLFGVVIYGYDTFPSIKLCGTVFLQKSEPFKSKSSWFESYL